MFEKEPSALPPNSTIGIIGGGQLGRMLAGAAAKLGFRTIVLEPETNCPAAQLSNDHIIAAYDDEKALENLARMSDVVTYEFENVPLQTAHFLEQKTVLHPPAKALEVAQDRITEKEFLASIGVPVAPFVPISTLKDLNEGLLKFGSGVLKTCRFGYDGKGQHVFHQPDTQEAERVFKKMGNQSLVLEQLVDFSSEFSIIAARSKSGATTSYGSTTNEHENGILRRSIAPGGPSDEGQRNQAEGHAARILEKLDYVGVIGVEFFDTDNGVLVNEIAPRVHNTGHWTVEGCPTGQFEQHIRAITGLPFGSTNILPGRWEMLNLLGSEANAVDALLEDGDRQITLYGKQEARPGRKMGHVVRSLPAN